MLDVSGAFGFIFTGSDFLAGSVVVQARYEPENSRAKIIV
jgi:hypothetical protein